MISMQWSLLLLTLASSPVLSFEVAVSSKKEITVFSQDGDQKFDLRETGTVVDIFQMENETKVLVKMQSKQFVWTTLSEGSSRQNAPFPFIPGVFKVLPTPSINETGLQLIAANEKSLFSVKDHQTSDLYQRKQVLDIVIDPCNSSLYLIDDQKLFVSSLEQPLSFSQHLPQINHAQLLASHSGQTVILTKNNDQRLHNADGFAIILSDGTQVCGSDPSEAYNIRSIDLNEQTLYLADALNSLIWQLQLDGTREICDLKEWQRISNPQKLALIHQNDVCISTKTSNQDQRNSYELVSNLAASTTQSIITSESDKDPCHNFCLNGQCSKTSLGVPMCHCGKNFNGERCENEPCRNYCLNEGICNISIGTPECQCKPGFGGRRCEAILPEALEIKAAIDYFQGFLIMSGLNVILFVVIISLTVCLIIQIRRKETNVSKVTKSPRTRVFSSSSTGRRSRSGPRKSGGTLNEAFVSTKGREDKCVDTKGHMCQALISDDGVVLDLEDCCNMTICEKPCIEASFRKPTSRVKKKAVDTDQLLTNVDFY